MLFDLRGRGRQRTVKVVYITLAFLLGGGLVLFGIGGDVSGGLVDAITERTGGTDDNSDRLRDREASLERRVQANPQDGQALAQLARTRVQLAGQGDNYDPATNSYTDEGIAELRQADQAWQRHLEASDRADDRVASLMVQAYAALNDLTKAVRAQEVVAESRDTSGAYAQLAALAYQAGQTRTGDLAREQALAKTDKDMREALKGQLDQAKQQATLEQLQSGEAPTGAPTPSPAGG